ncbi:uncharacterized protein BO97DRAFT_147930 [Aspergillus homomorphus CBS 101889]|uniref:Uncharacterized protein n=1 Tax=Aspergillus homomorphus (strain CBS 101889) TaxID=1450537 RepID=A0A395HQ62_ASPHC|nr:hypothetical protein BO97DRAFT_147930 [Aspergillus homomorphus CBS 101889]RAL10081.1 hypothetical protein BO97DRAFT_147930 [Aspergillus homomorphus CBS 101889]
MTKQPTDFGLDIDSVPWTTIGSTSHFLLNTVYLRGLFSDNTVRPCSRATLKVLIPQSFLEIGTNALLAVFILGSSTYQGHGRSAGMENSSVMPEATVPIVNSPRPVILPECHHVHVCTVHHQLYLLSVTRPAPYTTLMHILPLENMANDLSNHVGGSMTLDKQNAIFL